MVLTAHQGPVDTTMNAALQTSLFGSAELRCRPLTERFVDLDRGSSVLFAPAWLEGSDDLFERLRSEMQWRSMERPMYGRIVDVPRLICTVEVQTLGTTHPLRIVTGELETALKSKFFSVGLNYYRTGKDSVAWHRDTIHRTARPTTVALVSLGSPRTLAMRPFSQNRPKTAETTRSTVATRSTPRTRWQLGHGDLLVMAGNCQRDWEHCVPKERAVGPRISLAFRSTEAVEGPRIGGSGVPPLLASHKLR